MATDRMNWEWDLPEQKWYHKTCYAYAGKEDHECPLCGARDPWSFRWSDVMDWIIENGFHSDEYFGYQNVDLDREVFDVPESPRWVAVYWVEGASEGFRVHVEPVHPAKGQTIPNGGYGLIGKFWSLARAEEAVKGLQRFVNRGVRYR